MLVQIQALQCALQGGDFLARQLEAMKTGNTKVVGLTTMAPTGLACFETEHHKDVMQVAMSVQQHGRAAYSSTLIASI